jgi:uncharacterized protein (DUF1330 family)
MPAYVIVMVTVDDPEMYRKYTERTPPTIARYGGRFLARSGAVQTLSPLRSHTRGFGDLERVPRTKSNSSA